MTSGAVDRWVVNASPVILLGKAGIIHLLPALCTELVVPSGVLAEVSMGKAADEGHRWLQGAGRTFLREVTGLHPALSNWGGAQVRRRSSPGRCRIRGLPPFWTTGRRAIWPHGTVSRFLVRCVSSCSRRSGD